MKKIILSLALVISGIALGMEERAFQELELDVHFSDCVAERKLVYNGCKGQLILQTKKSGYISGTETYTSSEKHVPFAITNAQNHDQPFDKVKSLGGAAIPSQSQVFLMAALCMSKEKYNNLYVGVHHDTACAGYSCFFKSIDLPGVDTSFETVKFYSDGNHIKIKALIESVSVAKQQKKFKEIQTEVPVMHPTSSQDIELVPNWKLLGTYEKTDK